jgi:hypothetical protein
MTGGTNIACIVDAASLQEVGTRSLKDESFQTGTSDNVLLLQSTNRSSLTTHCLAQKDFSCQALAFSFFFTSQQKRPLDI